MKRRLLLIASKAGYQTAQFAAAAQRQMIELHLATDRCHQLNNPWGDDALAIDFRDPRFENLPDVDGIAAVGDQPAVIAAEIAEHKNLNFHPAQALKTCRDKFAMREAFRLAGLNVPWYQRITEVAGNPPFPCVLKPLNLSGSRGVIRVNNPAELQTAFTRIRRMTEGDLQLEQFIPGREFAIEGIVTNGNLHVFTIFDKPDPLDGPFFEETIYTTPSREPEPIQQSIVDTVKMAVTALNLTNGPIHAECRVNETGVYMLEVAGRPIGGLCARVLKFQSGQTLEDLIVRHALYESITSETLQPGGSAVMMIPIPKGGIYAGVKNLEEARSNQYIGSIEITAAPGQHLLPLPEGASYLGFIFAHAPTPHQAEAAVRIAHRQLLFEIHESLPMFQTQK